MKTKERYTYILNNDNKYKVGKTGKPENRFKTLLRMNAFSLSLVFFIKEKYLSESMLKEILREYHDHNEWYEFENESELQRYIKNYVKYDEIEEFVEDINRVKRMRQEIREMILKRQEAKERKKKEKQERPRTYEDAYWDENCCVMTVKKIEDDDYAHEFIQREENGDMFYFKYNWIKKRYYKDRYENNVQTFEEIQEKHRSPKFII